jgi:hypothetical protein
MGMVVWEVKWGGRIRRRLPQSFSARTRTFPARRIRNWKVAMKPPAVAKGKQTRHLLLWFRRVFASLSGGVVCGACVIPAVHQLIYGKADPFQHDWPLCLQASSLICSLIISFVFRSTTAAALGVYVGIVGFMLVSGQSEYPMSSIVGLMIHGFLPAALGAAIAFVVLNARSNDPRASAA